MPESVMGWGRPICTALLHIPLCCSHSHSHWSIHLDRTVFTLWSGCCFCSCSCCTTITILDIFYVGEVFGNSIESVPGGESSSPLSLFTGDRLMVLCGVLNVCFVGALKRTDTAIVRDCDSQFLSLWSLPNPSILLSDQRHWSAAAEFCCAALRCWMATFDHSLLCSKSSA